MTHLELVAQIEAARPGAQWTLHNNTYEGLIWHDLIQSKPTAQELGL